MLHQTRIVTSAYVSVHSTSLNRSAAACSLRQDTNLIRDLRPALMFRGEKLRQLCRRACTLAQGTNVVDLCRHLLVQKRLVQLAVYALDDGIRGPRRRYQSHPANHVE